MDLSNILSRITDLVRYLIHPGYNGNPIHPYSSLFNHTVRFITSHPLILFFVLIAFLFFGIKLIRRMMS